MKSIDHFADIFLYRFPVDMRKYRNGLCAIVENKMERSVFSKSLFVFTNRRRNIVRFLYWDDTGFAVWSKALEKDRYRWPRHLFEETSLPISSEQLGFLLRGMDFTSHKKLEYEKSF